MRRVRRLGITILILLFGILSSNIGLAFIFRILPYFTPIECSKVNGSLFSSSIHIPKLYYKTSSDSAISFQDVHIKGIDRLSLSASHIEIKSISLPLSALSIFTSKGSSYFSFKPHHISIEELNLETHSLIKPVQLTQIEISYQDPPTMSFYYNREPYQISMDRQQYDQTFILKILAQNYHIFLLGYVDENGFYFDSTRDSDLKNAHVRYTNNSKALGLYIDHTNDNQIIKGKGIISPNHIVLNVEDFHLKNEYLNINMHGTLNTKKKHFYFNAHINDSHIKTTLLENNSLLATGHIEELAYITPYVQGDCNFNIEYLNGLNALYLYSTSLHLPTSKLTDVQLSYDSKNPRYLNASASQLRNPALLLHNPSFTLQKSKNGDRLTAIAFYQDQLQQISAQLSNNKYRTTSEITIDKFILQTAFGDHWQLESDPIRLSESQITAPKIKLSHKDQYAEFDGHYDRTSDSWALNHHFDNMHISFNSQGIIDADTEVNIKNAVLNGKATLSSERFSSPKLEGYYDLSNISASLMNITPTFLFPLDYEIYNSHIYWKNGKLDADLKSSQGNVTIDHKYHGHHIRSQDISFTHHKNSIRGAVDLSYGDDNSLTGKLTLTEANFILSPDEAFESFPKDIDIVGNVSTAKPGSSNMLVNLELSAHETPVNLFGFTGKADSHLNITIPVNKPMVVTGEATIHNPSLILLNRSIQLKSLNINYQHQPWLKGNLNLTLEQAVTVSSASSQISNTDIQLSAFGTIDSPTFTITSIPVPISQLEAFTYIFAAADQLPAGNENYALLEAISGLKRNQGIVVLLQSISHVSKVMGVDISLRPEYNQNQTFAEGFIKSDLTLSRRINDNTLIIIRRQLNEENANIALNYKVNKWLSSEIQYNRVDNSFTASLFYRN